MHEVSVIIPAWNAEKTIVSCIDSILNQVDVAVDVIVVDDCSTDSTFNLVNATYFNDSRVRIIKNEENSGPSKSRNVAISAARYSWLAVVDADDLISHDRFVQLIAYATDHELDVVFDNIMKIDGVSHEQIGVLVPPSMVNLIQSHWNVVDYPKFNTPYVSPVLTGFLKPVLRKEFLIESGISYNEKIRNSEDYLFVLELLIKGAKIDFLDKPMYLYYVYPRSLSGAFNLDAHKQFVSQELKLLEKYKLQLSSEEQASIKLHLNQVILAARTNYLFSLLRFFKLKDLLLFVLTDFKSLPIHLWRVINSIFYKSIGVVRRGN